MRSTRFAILLIACAMFESATQRPVQRRPVPYKLDKQTWRIPAAAVVDGAIQIEYSISWDEAGPFNSQLSTHHAFVNFAEVLMYVPDRRAENIEVKFTDVPSDWKSIAELPAGSAPNSFTAESYDKLVDAPVEIGKFEEFEFDNAGAHFRVVVDSREWNRATLEDSLKRITGYEVKLMGGPPFKEYTFFFHIGAYPDAGGGGMEHANCTAIGGSSVEMVAAIAAHEFFHAWNVKRIRPQSLEPVDYAKEQYSRALWFAEGVTSTYGSFALERSGIWTKINGTPTSPSRFASSNRVLPANGRAWKNRASIPGSINTTPTISLTAASPTTTKASSLAICSISRFAMPPTITSRSMTSCEASTTPPSRESFTMRALESARQWKK